MLAFFCTHGLTVDILRGPHASFFMSDHPLALRQEQTTDLVQEQKQLTLLELNRLRDTNNAIVVNTLRTVLRPILHEMRGTDSVIDACLPDSECAAALEGRIARLTVRAKGEYMAMILEARRRDPHEDCVMEIYDPVAACVRETLAEWRKSRDCFERSKPIPGDRCNTLEQLDKVEELYPIPGLKAYERTRSAHYRAMTRSDVYVSPTEPSRIELSYNDAWLKPEEVKMAIDGDIPGFQKATKGGRFVYQIDELGDNSVRQELLRNLAAKDGLFQGRVLRTDYRDIEAPETGFPTDIEAWLTSNMRPDPKKKNTLRYIQSGVTGRVQYFNTPTTMEKMIRNAHLVVRFDTIKGDTRPAEQRGPGAARLMSKFAEELADANRQMIERSQEALASADVPADMVERPVIDLYALEHLFLESSDFNLAHLDHYLLPLGGNAASPKFFEDRALKAVARDNHTKAPRSKRIIKEKDKEDEYRTIEKEVLLRPSWIRFMGFLDEFVAACQHRWQMIRWRHGDYSPDKTVL
jgi:hypothetical protein